ncbi:XRE family transcriptional regulator [Bacillus haynesii]|nr:XRE family transcriptional regulator [Bacillus haynesii]
MFGLNRVKEYRKRCNLTQIELAKRVGVARQTINLIENDKYNPSLSLCISLAKELKTDLNTLFWEEKMNEESNT